LEEATAPAVILESGRAEALGADLVRLEPDSSNRSAAASTKPLEPQTKVMARSMAASETGRNLLVIQLMQRVSKAALGLLPAECEVVLAQARPRNLS
jgi:hypothetical protein